MKRVPTRWMAGVVMGMVSSLALGQRASDLVSPQLLADVSAVQAGKPFHVGVLLRIESKWHVYWKNPGDAGQTATVAFGAPPGFKVSEVEYPVPTKFLQPGDMVAYGYDNEVMLIATVTPPADLPTGDVMVRGKLKYLVCDKVCIPGKAELSLTLPASAASTPANEESFGEWLRQIPVKGTDVAKVADVKMAGSLSGKAGKYSVDVAWKAPAENVEFFPGKTATMNIQNITVKNKDKMISQISFDANLLTGQQPDVTALQSVIGYTDERGVKRGIEIAVPINQTK